MPGGAGLPWSATAPPKVTPRPASRAGCDAVFSSSNQVVAWSGLVIGEEKVTEAYPTFPLGVMFRFDDWTFGLPSSNVTSVGVASYGLVTDETPWIALRLSTVVVTAALAAGSFREPVVAWNTTVAPAPEAD